MRTSTVMFPVSIAALTGGRDRTATLAELEWAAEALVDRGATIVRHGGCKPRRVENDDGSFTIIGSTDTQVGDWIRARMLATVEVWEADWKRLGKPAGPIRNRNMLDGKRPDELVAQPPVDFLIRFPGGAGTRDCTVAALERSLHVHWIDAREEPRVWNRHHGRPPGPSVYCGGGTPVGNPFTSNTARRRDATFAEDPLASYHNWLIDRIAPGSRLRDDRIVNWIRGLTPKHYIVCSCAPGPCHGEAIVRAWRGFQRDPQARRGALVDL